ncbi:MAG: YeeE/YedE family protein [Desulfobacterales bacterium]|nr:YeeE/YedE family protein [Desulfobacterales bacterium]
MRERCRYRNGRAALVLSAFALLAGAGVAGAAGGPPPEAAAGAAAPWSPYVVGFGIGLLSCVAFLVSNRPIGVSTAYAQTSGMIGRLFAGSRVDRMPYYRAVRPEIGWEWMLAAGVLIGAWLSAVLFGDFRVEAVPPSWVAEFGPAAGWRWLSAGAGGVLLGVGSRWAGGCTSGHGISGTLQLVASSWLAVVCFFAGGVATAFLLY